MKLIGTLRQLHTLDGGIVAEALAGDNTGSLSSRNKQATYPIFGWRLIAGMETSILILRYPMKSADMHRMHPIPKNSVV